MASSFPKMQKGSANFSQSIRNRLRLKNLQAQAKNFCRVLDIRVTEVVEANLRDASPLQYPLQHIVDTVRRDGATMRGRKYILVIGFGFLRFQNFYRLGRDAHSAIGVLCF